MHGRDRAEPVSPGRRPRVALLIACASAGLACLLFVVALAQSSALHSDERVLLYPALARPAPGGWEVLVHGLVYEPERRRLMAALLRRAIGLDEDKMTAEEKQIFRERSGYFLVDDERDKKLAVTVGGQRFDLGVSRGTGHFASHWRWRTNDATVADWLSRGSNHLVELDLTLTKNPERQLRLQVHCLEPTGWSVISDIDDTIKVSQVRDRDQLLANTFSRPFRPVPGMAEVYRRWEQSCGAQFHYVTGSPWQLYQPLVDFTRSNGFPAGSFHMKPFRIKDQSVIGLFSSPEHYKPKVIEPFLQDFPQRRFILVGDSGEKDPEIYGALARKHPQQIRHIFIRNVTGEDADAPRYRKAFEGVPRESWKVFKEASELRGAVPE